MSETGLNREEKKQRLKNFLQEQTVEILKYKWILSEKNKRDMGQEAILDWLHKYGEKYRKEWEKINGEV